MYYMRTIHYNVRTPTPVRHTHTHVLLKYIYTQSSFHLVTHKVYQLSWFRLCNISGVICVYGCPFKKAFYLSVSLIRVFPGQDRRKKPFESSRI